MISLCDVFEDHSRMIFTWGYTLSKLFSRRGEFPIRENVFHYYSLYYAHYPFIVYITAALNTPLHLQLLNLTTACFKFFFILLPLLLSSYLFTT